MLRKNYLLIALAIVSVLLGSLALDSSATFGEKRPVTEVYVTGGQLNVTQTAFSIGREFNPQPVIIITLRDLLLNTSTLGYRHAILYLWADKEIPIYVEFTAGINRVTVDIFTLEAYKTVFKRYDVIGETIFVWTERDITQETWIKISLYITA
jgi:hypothetical protein